MVTTTKWLAGVLALAFGSTAVHGQKREPRSTAPTSMPAASALDISRLMSAGEFREAGLGRLTPDELAALNGWLTAFAMRIYELKAKTTSSCPDVIEAKIDGEFSGWQGESIYKLTNGQIWQQATYSYSYTYKYSPGVIIFPGAGGCKMKVDDADPVAVKRIK